MSRRAVVFALDADPGNIFGLEFAAVRIRQHNPHIPIHVFFQDRIPSLRPSLRSLNGLTIHSLRTGGPRPPWFLMSAFLKWYAIAALRDYEDIVYLDTDTIVFDDIELLFDDVGVASFAARSFEGRFAARRRFGVIAVEPCLSYISGVRRLAGMLGIEPTLHFNSGVMVFRHGFSARIAQELHRLERFFHLFMFGVLPVPLLFGNVWFTEELCARFFVVMCGLTHFHAIRETIAPYWIEYVAREAPPPGVVIHTFRAHYRAAMLEFAKQDELERFFIKRSKWRQVFMSVKSHICLGLSLLQLSFWPHLRGRVARWYLGLASNGIRAVSPVPSGQERFKP